MKTENASGDIHGDSTRRRALCNKQSSRCDDTRYERTELVFNRVRADPSFRYVSVCAEIDFKIFIIKEKSRMYTK